jgi:hypothetical protein
MNFGEFGALQAKDYSSSIRNKESIEQCNVNLINYITNLIMEKIESSAGTETSVTLEIKEHDNEHFLIVPQKYNNGFIYYKYSMNAIYDCVSKLQKMKYGTMQSRNNLEIFW